MDDAYSNGMNPPYGGVHQRPPYDQANGLQSQHYQGAPNDGAQTLPPIQAQRPALHHSASSYDQHYRPQGINWPMSTAPYQSYYGQSVAPAPYNQSQNLSQYSNDSFARATTQPGTNFDYASAPGQNNLPLLRPMPSTGFDPAQRTDGLDASGSNNGNPPRPVVGSQGRRGILPSDDGRPPVAAVDGDTSGKANFNPAKGADGKYACPHCPKTYLHAKHLKRHHLRRMSVLFEESLLC